MKFLIKDNPISYDEIYSAIRQYIQDNEGKNPSYMLIHPETRRNILISSQDEHNGMRFTVVQHRFSYEKDDFIKSMETVFGLYLMQTTDIEPGFVIICG